MELKPVAALPLRSGSPGPSNYEQVVSLAKRLAAVFDGLEPAQYRLADVVAALADDPVSRLASLLPPDSSDVGVAALYLGHDAQRRHDGAAGVVLVQDARELAWRQQQVVAAVEKAAVPVRELFLGGEGSVFDLMDTPEQRCITVRLLQRRLRAGWVTSWGLRGHLDRLAAAGECIEVASAQRPATVWRLRTAPS